ncbi:hypothetical protein IL306_014626 [Fusarium sp. DS 682]|nr:hypothetical protein IL306_014626 [Fusarium sp. DS 682]
MVGKLTLEQTTKLRAVKKKSGLSDEKRWLEWYKIIFPDQDITNPSLTPSDSTIPDHEPSNTRTAGLVNSSISVSMSRYRDSLAGPSDAKKRKLERNFSAWGVSDPDLCRTLARKVQEYQYQDLQEFIERSHGDSEAQNDGRLIVPEPAMDDFSTFLDFGQMDSLTFF